MKFFNIIYFTKNTGGKIMIECHFPIFVMIKISIYYYLISTFILNCALLRVHAILFCWPRVVLSFSNDMLEKPACFSPFVFLVLL